MKPAASLFKRTATILSALILLGFSAQGYAQTEDGASFTGRWPGVMRPGALLKNRAAFSAMPRYKEGEVLVRLKGAALPDMTAASVGVSVLNTRRLYADEIAPNMHLMKLMPGQKVNEAVEALRLHPDVESVQPNYLYRALSTTPNDPYFGDQWDMYNTGQADVYGQVGTVGDDMRMPDAWGISTGTNTVVVGVIDTGIDYYHPDLYANLWTGPYGNHGFNAITGTTDPYDDDGHGTHVSGTIGAVGNNGFGVSGVNWTTRIMALKFLDSTGSGSDADAIECINYAISQKRYYGVNIRVLSASWGGAGADDPALDSAIGAAGANGMLFVAAAGNNGTDNGVYPFYPARSPEPNVIAVAATDNNDHLPWWSNYGVNTVHVAAPGVGILSTYPTPGPAVYSDNFDTSSALSGWHFGGTTGVWGLTSAQYSSAPNSLAAVASGSTDSHAIWGPFNLTGVQAQMLTCNMNFSVRYASNNDHDDLYVLESTDGVNWYIIDDLYGASGGYFPYQANIPDLAGKSKAYVAFELVTSGGTVDSVYIDDAAITKRPTAVTASGKFAWLDGTSMATPHVSGLAALMLSVNPTLTVSDLKKIIMETVDYSGLPVISGGRVNAYKALQAAQPSLSLAAPAQDGAYTMMSARLSFNNGTSIAGRSVSFYQDGTVVGSAYTASKTSASPGVATLRFLGKLTPASTPTSHDGYATAGFGYGVTLRSSDENYTTYPPTIATTTPIVSDTTGTNTGAPGTAATISGSYFGAAQGAGYVRTTINGVATNLTIISWHDTAIRFKVPAAIAGTYSITVYNGLGTSSSTPLIIPSPAIGTFSPPTAGTGITVTIGGAGFGAITGTATMTAQVTGALPTALTIKSWSDSAIAFVVPSIAAKSYTLAVHNAAGTTTATFVLQLPSIAAPSPSTAGPGIPVTVNGTYFGTVKGSVLLSYTVGITTYTTTVTPTVWTDNGSVAGITFIVPSIAAKTYSLSVHNAAGTSGATSFTIPTPAITKLNPGTAGPGAFVNMSGVYFGATTGTVYIAPAASPTLLSAVTLKSGSWSDNGTMSKVTFISPPKPFGTYSISVHSAAGTGHSSPFYIPQPLISSLSPSTAGQGDSVVITATGFGATLGTVYIAPQSSPASLAAVTLKAGSWSDTGVTFFVPARLAGAYNIVVINGAGRSALSTATTLTIPPPGISDGGVSPPSAGPGDSVSITGTGFGLTKGSVLLSYISAGITYTTTVTPTAWTDASITFTVPSIAAKTYNLTVHNAAGTSATAEFIMQSPSITSLTAPGNTAAPGMSVGINGQYFGLVKGSVLLSYVSGTSVITTTVTPTYWSDSLITFTVPQIAAKTYTLRVSDVANTTGGASSTSFTIPNPAINTGGISPSSAGPGDVITITGTGFGLTKGSVLLSYISAGITYTTTVTPTLWGDTGITFTVPGIAAKTYNLSVHNAAGTSVSTTFTIPTPALDPTTPLSLSTAGPGIPITITGTGFGLTKGSVLLTTTSGTIATTTVTPTAWSDTSIVFNVPSIAGNKTYNLTVHNAAGTSATTPFTIPPPVIGSLDSYSAKAGTAIHITGTGFGLVKGSVRLYYVSGGITYGTTVTPTSWGDTAIAFTVPAIAARSYSLTVSNPAGTTAPITFTVTTI